MKQTDSVTVIRRDDDHELRVEPSPRGGVVLRVYRRDGDRWRRSQRFVLEIRPDEVPVIAEALQR